MNVPRPTVILILLLLIPGLILGGCRMLVGDGQRPSPAGTTPVTRLTLHERLVVPAGKWSVYFQRGVATSFGGVDEYQPYCELQVTGPAAYEQFIEPGEFEVLNVRNDVDAFLNAPVKVASSALRVGGLLDREFVLYETVMHLRSDHQPRVSQLRCARLDELRVGVFLSLAEIREALGNIMTLGLQASSAPVR